MSTPADCVAGLEGGMMPVSELGSIATDTALGALLVSAFAALTGTAGWLGVRLWDWHARQREVRAEHRAAMVKFYLDVCIFMRNGREVFGGNALEQAIDLIQKCGQNFKAYVESNIDDTANKRMNELIHTLDSRMMPIVRSYILYHELLQRQYVRIGTEEFAALEVERKIKAMRVMFQNAARVMDYGSLLIDEFKKLGYISALDADITRALDSADQAALKAVAEKDPA